MLRLLTTAFLFLLFVNQSQSQNYKTDLSVAQRAELLVEVLNQNHCEPQKLDNAFSKKIILSNKNQKMSHRSAFLNNVRK